MKLKALSHYDDDMDTRFGDCILLHNNATLIVYDCGHTKHAETVGHFLQSNSAINVIHVVISHNDCDHTNGAIELLEWLAVRSKYTVSVYTHQYLKHVDTILDKIDDGRRNRESLKRALLAEFDNIREIIEKAQEYGFSVFEALSGTDVGECTIVGPKVDEFTDAAAQAVDNRVDKNIGEGHAEETAMNAASIQLKCKLDNAASVLLCGDACPDYLNSLNDYNIIQLPHHGQKDDAIAIFDEMGGDAYLKKYLISDNTGSAATSGGSDALVQYMLEEKYSTAYNTKTGEIVLPYSTTATVPSNSQGRTYLGDLGSI